MCVEIIKVASEVLNFSRQRTLVNMRFLEPAIRMLTESPSKCMRNRSYGMGTDGKNLYYNPEYVLRAYQKEKGFVSRMYLHLVVHGIFRHFFVNPQIEQRKWDLACDMATEYIIESWKLDFADISAGADEKRELDRIRKNVGLMNAEKIYGYLKKTKESEIDWLEKIFRRDDHSFWYPETKNRNDVIQVKSGQVNQNREVMFSNQKLEELWKQAAKKIQVDLETFMKSRSGETGDFLVNLKLANRKKQDYSAFLRKFTRLGERMKINDEEFDYNFYTYGMQLYGNMPLIEPLETRETRKIEDFVIAIDTSMSTSGELVRAFLERTCELLQQNTSFFRRINLRILQCDDKLRSDKVIHDAKEFADYMSHFELIGQSATDFRPVFEHVDQLVAEGAFHSLRGLIYFTDGLGLYPKKRPKYDAAFVMLEGECWPDSVPPWGIRVILREDEIITE